MPPRSSLIDTQARRNIRAIGELEQQALDRRSSTEKVSGSIVYQAGRMWTILVHVLWFTVWMLWNSGAIPGVGLFDPFPYPALTTIVSLEAIFLALFILVSQNRASRRADERAQLDLQINLLAEHEATKMLQLLRALCAYHGLEEAADAEVEQLVRETEPANLAHEIERQFPSE